MNLRKIDRRIITVLLIVFVQMLGASMAMPILPLYAKRQFAMSPQTITMLVSSFFFAQFLAGPWIGRMSDRYGRIPILLLSQIGTVLSFVMLVLAQNPAMLFVSRLLDGFTGGNIIVAQAYITDITPQEKRTESLGYIFAVFGLGFIFGPALGGVLSAYYGERVPFIFAAVAATLVVILTWRTLDETLSPDQRLANKAFRSGGISLLEVTRNLPLLLILVVAFVGQFALGMLQATFALFGEVVLFVGYDERATNLGIGILLSLVGVSQFLTQAILLQRMLKRFGDSMLVIIGGLLRSFAFLAYIIIISPWMAGLGSIFFALGQGLMMPPLQSLATSTVPDEFRGGVLGIYQSSISLSTIISTAIAGMIFAVEPTLPYQLASGLSILVIVPAFFFFRQEKAKKISEAL